MIRTTSRQGKNESRTVISRDGTIVSFLSVGEGAGVIVLPGVLSMASDYAAFASALAGNPFTRPRLPGRTQGGDEDVNKFMFCREPLRKVIDLTNVTLKPFDSCILAPVLRPWLQKEYD